MSSYPVWWDTTVTIYNKYEDPQTHVISWFRNTVAGCFWKDAGNTVTVGQTVLETNDIICRVPQDDRFLESYAWKAKPNDQKPNYFTLGPEDILIRGEVEDIVNEYQAGHRSSDLLQKYKARQGCLQINKSSINIGAGRCYPHYYVRGV